MLQIRKAEEWVPASLDLLTMKVGHGKDGILFKNRYLYRFCDGSI